MIVDQKSSKRELIKFLREESVKDIQQVIRHINDDSRLEVGYYISGLKDDLVDQLSEDRYVTAQILYDAIDKVFPDVEEDEDNDEEENESCEDENENRGEISSLDQLKVFVPNLVQKSKYNFSYSGVDQSQLDRMLRALKGFVSYRESKSKLLHEIKNMNVLFHGPSGVGKTELAKFLSQELDIKLIILSSADVLSQWIGNTENNIKNIFKIARENNAMIFFDEFEGVISSRETAKEAHQLTQVNQLLSEIEQFEGIFIAATNHIEKFDPASLRRFAFEMQFQFLDESGIDYFHETYLKPISIETINRKTKERLMQIRNLTPGDFLVCYKRFVFLGKVNEEELVDDLIKISNTKRQVQIRLR